MKIYNLLIVIPLLSGCSLYESDGRKFLEKNLSTIGVTVKANVKACDHEEPKAAAWMMLEKISEADLYALEGEAYDLRVNPNADKTYNCYFQFPSAQEMYEKSASAVEWTLKSLAAEK